MDDHRRALINGLLNLAIFLETHPDVPVSSNLTLHHFPNHDNDDDLRAEIDQIAARVGSQIDFEDSPYAHYATSVSFGPVEYRAVAILAAAQARHDAEDSYRGCIDPN
ncbi:hypothetical protein HCN51_45570 [Nonomuraea sp. FMUSA5-5]|uniref:Uncharacterized protein n=1 Tax=Nonomuraea composti TaxID=2720023 RepID=A0ABX1BFV8_9ACTN|nr:hypothetical protein [Nonomuraea sp. FMUSA5-5]NJP96625.1 hypothetical protein [Nonomuraea sp. FMUSA5-5]